MAENKELLALVEELQKEVAILKEKEPQEEVTLTEGQKQALMEKRYHEAMEKAKKDTVKITLPIDPGTENQEVFVSVNGVRYMILRGVEVEVPKFVAEVLNDAQRQKLEAIQHMKTVQKKARDRELN